MAALETVSLILNRLGPLIEREVNLHLNSQLEAEKLTSNLKKIRELLDDAEGKHLSDPDIKRSFEVLQTAAYDMEDALDEWDIAKRAADNNANDVGRETSEPLNFWEKVCPFVHSLCSCFNQVVEHRRIAQEIVDLNEVVDQVYGKAKEELKLAPRSHSFKRERSISTIVEADFHGRESDIDTVKTILFSDDEDGVPRAGGVPVVSIIGEGGIGKTTLAQLLYNDVEVGDEFEIRIWICVSDTFDDVRIAKEILEGLEGHGTNISGLDSLARKIKESIAHKPKFLLVLDDVWDDDHQKWKSIKGYLSGGAEGSKILVTTRNETVATLLGSTEPQMHRLEPVTDEDCWSIIKQIALNGKDVNHCRRFEGVGRDIAKKCKGSPLAAQVLGGHLVGKINIRDWKHILDSEIWELKNVENDLFRHFFLSYDALEQGAKRCFSYCAVFPKDSIMKVDNLIRIWMALGFLSSNDMEREGRAYFDELAQRSFFQNLVKDKEFGEQIVQCKMHDVVHDFAQYLMGGECCIMLNKAVDSQGGKGETRNNENVRHLFCGSIANTEHLNREILRSYFQDGTLSIRACLLGLKRVRALTLHDCFYATRIPEDIGNLIHLRYLDMFGNDTLKELPETICNLYNMQTLVLERCDALVGLPQGISKLTNMRHIPLGDRGRSNFLIPEGLERLTNLRTLNYFYAGKESRNKLGCLKNLNQLDGRLTIVLEGLEEDTDVDEAKKAELHRKEHIYTLVIKTDNCVRLEVVDALQAPPQLESLTCNADPLPFWISSLENLRRLEIGGVRLKSFSRSSPSSKWPDLWKLPFLEELLLTGRVLERWGRDFLGLTSSSHDIIPFPQLKKLEISYCILKKWEDISEEEAQSINVMPCLNQLKIIHCTDLKSLPHRFLQVLPSLEHLQIKDCFYLKLRYENEDRDAISHIPFVEFVVEDDAWRTV